MVPAGRQDSSPASLESSAEEPSVAQQAESRIKCPTQFHKNYVKETEQKRVCTATAAWVGQISNCFTHVPNKNNSTLLRVLTVAEQAGGA